MRDENLDIEESGEGINLHDLTLDEFIADLRHYIEQHRATLESTPFGIQAVVNDSLPPKSKLAPGVLRPGAIFCLKRNGDPNARTPNRLWPYFLVYVREDGAVRYGFKKAHQCLSLFRELTFKRGDPATELEDAFDQEIQQGQSTEPYDSMLAAALQSIEREFRKAELEELQRNRGAVITEKSSQSDTEEKFTLITWLMIVSTRTRER